MTDAELLLLLITVALVALLLLVSTLSASDVRLSGRIRVELVAEIAL